ncbi:hypothetical protein [Streptomyces vilmorinianum]|uniref:hypothetical protein n=1 Tax=Streptomyces vilmorinianum TaxID=3051092 RepID=UPI0010FB2A0B|nr:hypothetical protein [Streptomyces vilmorinianum]
MTALAVRPLLSTAVATLALSGVALAGAPAAFAAPGDNGDIKIHRKGTVEPDQSNHPKVCEFHIAAFNFDGLQQVHWEIFNQPGSGPFVREGDITLDPSGDGYTTDMTLPDGMYKVEWTFMGQQGAKKSKVFKVECENGNGGNGSTKPPHHKPPHHKPPHGPVGAGGGGSADTTGTDSSAFGVGSALAAGLAGTAGLILIRRSRRRTDGAA